MCQLVERGDVIAVLGIELDEGNMMPGGRPGYVGDMVASILSYIGLPFLQVCSNFVYILQLAFGE